MTPELLQLLRSAPADRLAELIESLYGRHSDIDSRIEASLLKSDPRALAKQLKSRIQSLRRGTRFIPYRESAEFGLRLEAIVDDIEPLVESDPKAAFDLAERFMATHEKVLDRVDDSGGDIAPSYHGAVGLWLRAAGLLRRQEGEASKVDWPALVLSHHEANDYGMWDKLIEQSAILLSEEELRRLAWRFEGEIRRETRGGDDDRFDRRRRTAAIGLASVARALGEVSLYERSTLLLSPEPNALQKKDIIEFCLSVNDGDTALKWLVEPWDGAFAYDRRRLLDETLLMLGRDEELISLRRDAYEHEPGVEQLEALLEVLPEDEKAGVQAAAVDKARRAATLSLRVETLIALGAEDQAAAEVLASPDELNAVFYGGLIEWAKALEASRHYLATVACYRVLLAGILEGGRTKGYRHAARYYRLINELDLYIESYHPLEDAASHEAMLREKHGLKRSFWQKV